MPKIYTKTGDDGTTGLVSGARVKKYDSRIELYGEVDELNSYLGLVVSHLVQIKKDEIIDAQVELLKHVQNNLFNLGSQLACELDDRSKYKLPEVDSLLIPDLEKEIDKMTDRLEPLKNFILPGGSTVSGIIHVVRTTARRVERKLVAFDHTVEPAPLLSIILLNRTSDYLFVLARYVNRCLGCSEILWGQKTKAPTSGA